MVEIWLKLCLSGICGLILGLERESKHKPLGIKTCVVISVTSCLLTIVSIGGAALTDNKQSFISADPLRLAAQIVSGVGFLGAGVILRKNNDVISGLTTAAIVWTASGLGIAVGAGFYIETLSGVALIFLGIKVIPFIMKKIGPRALREQEVKISVMVGLDENIQNIIEEIRRNDIHVKDVKIRGREEGHKIELYCTVKDDGKNGIFKYYETVRIINGINRVEVESI